MTTGNEVLTNQGRISTKRLKAAIKAINAVRKGEEGVGRPPEAGNYPGFPASNEERNAWVDKKLAVMAFEKANSAERATALYSLRSHLRGRLHITHQYVQVKDEASPIYGACKMVVVERNMEDQEILVAPLMLEFKMTDAEATEFMAAQEKRRELLTKKNTGTILAAVGLDSELKPSKESLDWEGCGG